MVLCGGGLGIESDRWGWSEREFFIKRGETFCFFQKDVERFIKIFVFQKGSNINNYLRRLSRFHVVTLMSLDSRGKVMICTNNVMKHCFWKEWCIGHFYVLKNYDNNHIITPIGTLESVKIII